MQASPATQPGPTRGRVLVTGANGFIARQLVRALLTDRAGLDFTELVLLDLFFDDAATGPRVRQIGGSIADEGVLRTAFSSPFDVIFHMVSIAGGLAEQNFELGLAVNLKATEMLLELARAQTTKPVLVYSSSIGVYGDLPDTVTDETPALPDWSYGTHKLIGELLVTDYSRRGFVDGRSLRFPGIVARPPGPSGALSSFLSDIILELAAGKPYVCPVSAEAQSWWMSVGCCVDNVLHAARMPQEACTGRRVWPLPPLRASIGDVAAAVGRVYGTPVDELLSYRPNPGLEERFGRLPPACFNASDAAGFQHDGSVDELVKNAIVTEVAQPESVGVGA